MKKRINTIIIAIIAMLTITCIDNNLQINTLTNKETDTLYSFFGRQIVLNDSILEQISTIAQQDKMLLYSDSILQIGDVRWRVNLHDRNLTLFTSVEPDDSQMLPVINYVNSIYGYPYEEEEYHYLWSSSNNPKNFYAPGRYTLVRLRRVRSEEGGTFLFFD